MPFITAQKEWSAAVSLSQDEDWINQGPGTVMVTREALTGTADGGVPVPVGKGYAFNVGDDVRCRTVGNSFAKIWREQI